jgi:hypothetical protein
MKTKKPIERSMAGLRDALFEMMEALRAGDVDEKEARTFSQLAISAIKATEVQIDYERLRLESKVPGHLPEMRLIPPLKAVNE